MHIPAPFKPGREERLEARLGDRTEKMLIKSKELYVGEVEDMADAVLKGEKPRISVAQSRGNIAAIVALLEISPSGEARAVVSNTHQRVETSGGNGVIRFRRRTVWSLVFAGLLAAAGVSAWRLGLLESLFGGEAPLRVLVTGHNWWWEFDYVELGVKTAHELHVPEGRRVQLELISVDVLHTLSIPELNVQADALPGRTTQVQLGAARAGEYGGACSEICGLAHNMMRAKVVVQSQADFDAWIESQRQPAAVPQSEEQWRGYEMLTTACAKCHSLDPAEKRPGLLGPNLAHLMSRSVFAGATFELNQSNLRRWLRDTQAMKAGNDMRVNLPRDDYEAVIQYLLMLE